MLSLGFARLGRILRQAGTDKLTREGRNPPCPTTSSGGLGRFRPRGVSASPKMAKSGPGDQMRLQVEGVVDGGMNGKEALC